MVIELQIANGNRLLDFIIIILLESCNQYFPIKKNVSNEVQNHDAINCSIIYNYLILLASTNDFLQKFKAVQASIKKNGYRFTARHIATVTYT